MLTRQLRLTVCAHKTLFMPWLIPIGHATFSQSLFTACAAGSKLFLVAGHTVVVVLVRNEGLGANRLLTAVTDKATLVPCGACILQFSCTWHDDLVTGDTFGGELITVAVVAEQCVILAGEGFVCQRAVAAETTETMLVIMSVLVEELPCIMANKLFAFVTGV